MSLSELAAMRQAITLAALRIGATAPNPPVGCLIISPDDGTLLGAGYHARKREPHAEVNALRAAGSRAQGATAIVTLEPCCHIGATPACHQALINAGIARVVVALEDPTSRGQGGITLLRQAGLDVVVGVAADEARLLLTPWLRSIEHDRPFLIIGVPSPNDDGTRTQLRDWAAPGIDLVIDEHGHATEAVPGRHRTNVLQLPSQPLPTDPHDAVTVLRRTGARRVLILTEHPGDPRSGGLLAHAWIDRVLTLTRDPGTPSLTPVGDTVTAVPEGWVLEALTPVSGGIICEYRRASSP